MADTNLIANVRFAVNEGSTLNQGSFITDQKINELALYRAREDRQFNFSWISHHNWALGLFDVCLFNARFGDKQNNLTYSLNACGSLTQDGINEEFDILVVANNEGSPTGSVEVLGDITGENVLADGARVQIAGSLNNNLVFTVVSTNFDDPNSTILLDTVEDFLVTLDGDDTTGKINAVDSRDVPSGIVEVFGAPVPFKDLVVDVIQFLLLHKAKAIADFNGRPFHFVVEDLKKQLGQFKGFTSFG